MGDTYDDYVEPALEGLRARQQRRNEAIARRIDAAEAERNIRKYVVGLAHDGDYMAFVRKNRPEWQAGKLNGIGGKVEEGEPWYDAMIREFIEETGTRLHNWRPLVTMTYPEQCRIMFYTARVDAGTLGGLYTATDEPIEVHTINYVRDYPHQFIRNLRWIVPLALAEEEYADVAVTGYTDPLMGPIKENTTNAHTATPRP